MGGCHESDNRHQRGEDVASSGHGFGLVMPSRQSRKARLSVSSARLVQGAEEIAENLVELVG